MFTNWMAWAVVVCASEPTVVSDTDTEVILVELSVVCAVVTVAVGGSVAVVALTLTAAHTVRMTLTKIHAAVFFTPVFIAYTVTVNFMRVFYALITVTGSRPHAA